ncbi:MAG: heparinase II/III-family protein [Planctomycetaceae bacterium]|nr:heparinase II/III-family protein [Planctomycetaceae bacterium]
MFHLLHRIGLAALLLTSALGISAPIYYDRQAVEKLGPGVNERITQIAAMLEERPGGFAVGAQERSFWDAVGQTDAGKSILKKADTLLAQAMPVLTDELYLLYSETGNRTEAQKVMFAREDRLVCLCLAECIENKGRFVKPLEELLDSLVSYRSWLYPAHDGNLANFHGKAIKVDLKSARDAHNYALCLYLLEGKLSAALAQKVQSRVQELVLAPYAKDVLEEGRINYWKTATHNWNPVCHAGVVGAALTMLADKLDRALFVERAMHYIENYYRGFTPDGYCSEGLGYWNYGYGQYIVLSEVIYSATGGKIDLFANPKGLAAAVYPFRIEVIDQQYPALADCDLNTRPQAGMMAYVNARLGLGDLHWPLGKELSGRNSLFEFLMFNQMDLARPVLTPRLMPDQTQLRTWFANAGVLICRPAKDSGYSFAAVLKGGHNGEHHNHNDLGTFIVVLDDTQLIVDPGRVEYTKTTFGKDRYTIRKLASYGHCVPLVAGKQQKEGPQSIAKILRRQFTPGDDTPADDTLVMDLKSAYPVEELQKLERAFVYSRSGGGCLIVTDDVEFSTPQSFETALITYGTYTRTDTRTLELSDNGKTAIVEISSGGNGIEISDQPIEQTKGSPRRIAIAFEKPVKKGQISMKIWPK